MELQYLANLDTLAAFVTVMYMVKLIMELRSEDRGDYTFIEKRSLSNQRIMERGF